jgi:hypothetical protein
MSELAASAARSMAARQMSMSVIMADASEVEGMDRTSDPRSRQV